MCWVVERFAAPAGEREIPMSQESRAERCWPLLFSYRDTVFGNGFVAEVRAKNGRAVSVREADDVVWFYGVNPGGMAAVGRSFEEAHAAFRRTFRDVLADFADGAETFADLRAAVQEFFDETNAPAEQDWVAAVDAVRAGRVEVATHDLPRKPAESKRNVQVTEKTAFTARDNEVKLQHALAA